MIEIVKLHFHVVDPSSPSDQPRLSDSSNAIAELFHVTPPLPIPRLSDISPTSVLITGIDPSTTYEQLLSSLQPFTESRDVSYSPSSIYAIVTFNNQSEAKKFAAQAQGFDCRSKQLHTAQGQLIQADNNTSPSSSSSSSPPPPEEHPVDAIGLKNFGKTY